MIHLFKKDSVKSGKGNLLAVSLAPGDTIAIPSGVGYIGGELLETTVNTNRVLINCADYSVGIVLTDKNFSNEDPDSSFDFEYVKFGGDFSLLEKGLANRRLQYDKKTKETAKP